MATYYVYPSAAGSDDGSSEANAWTSLQRAIDGTGGTQPAAGDTVLCRTGGGSDETLSAQIDVDGNVGTSTTGWIKYIGVNSSWVNDGSQYTIDGNSAVAHCLDFNQASAYYHIFENFVFTDATAEAVAVDTSGGSHVAFINCAFTSSQRGITCRRNIDGIFVRCLFANNTGNGVYRGANACLFFACCFRDNGASGFNSDYTDQTTFINCLFFDNAGWGVELPAGSKMINCVLDNNSSGGIYVLSADPASTVTTTIGNRITNHSGAGDIGLNCNSVVHLSGWNYFEDNDGDNIQNATYYHEITNDGSATNIEDQADTNEGYTSLTEGSEDYNLASDATSREQEISIPTGQ